MVKNLIPNFLFYPNLDSIKIIKSTFNLIKYKNNLINNIKIKINDILQFTNFTLIYFYIGNFFIKNKLKKTLKNLIIIKNNYYILSDINLNFNSNLKNFFINLEKLKKYNIKKIIIFFNNKYYRPFDLIKLPFFYFLFFTSFLLNFKINLIYFNLSILNIFYILKKKLINK